MSRGSTYLKKTERELLKKLEQLGGNLAQEDSLTFEGTKLIIPENMTPSEAIDTIDRYIRQMEAPVSFDKTFQYRPWDGAAAVARTLKKLFGFSGIGVATQSFFGSRPPQLHTIPIGPNNETLQVPWGKLEVPPLQAMLTLGGTSHPEYGPLFHISVTCPRKYRGHIEGLFMAIDDELKQNSIYKASAIDGQDMPEFLDTSGVSPEKVIYSEDVMQQLEANLWSMLRHTEEHEALGLPLKRAVLLHGPYGTGKTLAATLTAQIATENGWTFLYCRPSKDKLSEVMQTARLYQPAVVFFEDVDVIAENGEPDNVSKLLDVFDGIQAKGTKLLAVMTTNHIERIHKGMVRPGRLDAVIEINSLDRAGIEKMIKSIVPADKLGKVDFDAVADAMEDFKPAFVKEAVDRTLRYALARNSGKKVDKLDTADFVQAANGLRPQLQLMEDATEGTKRDTLTTALERIVKETLEASIVDYDGELPNGRLVVGEPESHSVI